MSVPNSRSDGSIHPPQAPQRNTVVFVVSILLTLVGAFYVLLGLYFLLAVGTAFGVSGALVITAIILVVVGICPLAGGLLGVKNAADHQKAGLLFNIGIGLCAVAVINLILSVLLANMVAFVAACAIFLCLLSGLYLYGAIKMRNQAA